MLFILNKKLKKQFILLILITIIAVFLETLGIASFLPILTFLIEPEIYKKFNFFNISEDNFFRNSLLIIGAVFILKNLFLTFFKYFQLNFTKNIQVYLTERLVNHYIYSNYIHTFTKGHAELLRNVLFEVNKVQGFANHLAELLTEVFVFFSIFILAFYFNPRLTLIVSLIFVLLFLIIFFSLKKKITNLGKQDIDLSEKRIIYLENIFHGLTEIKVYKKENDVTNLFYNYNLRLNFVTLITSLLKIIPKYFLEIALIFLIINFIFFGLHTGKTINNLLLDISFYAIIVYRLFPSLNRILASSQSVKNLSPSLKLISRELIRSQDVIKNTNEDVKKFTDFNIDIKIENLIYNFPNKKLFNNQTLTIRKNKLILISGANGSGKTSLINIFLGMHEPQNIKIVIDNQKIFKNFKDCNLNISYVPAKPFLLNDTIKKNILFFDPYIKSDFENTIDYSWFKNLLNQFNLKENHLISESGKNISEGEKQKISLARALYRKPQILILDEPTSNLDLDTKKLFFETVNKMKSELTIILVSHENKNLINFDYNIHINDGKIDTL